MLLDRKDVIDLLRCPRTGRPLKRSGDRLVVAGDPEAAAYDIVGDCPVLVDFERSVLDRDAIGSLASVVERRTYGGPLGLARRLVSPPKGVTAANVRRLLDRLLARGSRVRVLIVGGGTVGQGMAPFYADARIDLVSFDIYASPQVQFVADAHSLPLPDGAFDAAVVQAVLEHVLDPAAVVAEIGRVLKDDGLVYAETPFLQHVHEGPYDFTRFTESGHRYLFRDFEEIASGASAGAGTQLLWSLDNFARGVFRSRAAGRAVKLLFFWLRGFDRLIPEPYNVDAASGVYFLGRKQSPPVTGRQIIARYKGAQT